MSNWWDWALSDSLVWTSDGVPTQIFLMQIKVGAKYIISLGFIFDATLGTFHIAEEINLFTYLPNYLEPKTTNSFICFICIFSPKFIENGQSCSNQDWILWWMRLSRKYFPPHSFLKLNALALRRRTGCSSWGSLWWSSGSNCYCWSWYHWPLRSHHCPCQQIDLLQIYPWAGQMRIKQRSRRCARRDRELP